MHFSTLATVLVSVSSVLAAPTPTFPTTTIEERQSYPKSYPPSYYGCKPVGIKNPGAVVAAFTNSGVVPTLVPSINPTVNVAVKYPAKAVKLGNKFTTLQTTFAPTYAFSAEKNYDPTTTTYSFFMIDPDVPNAQSPVRVNYLHWYVAGNSPSCIQPQSPQTVTEYESPTPLSTTQHRYTFLVYREPPGYVPDTVTAQIRPGFDINAYAANAGLVLVGGNFFLEAVTNT